MIVDGKKIATELSVQLKNEFAQRETQPRLGALLMEPDFATEKFISIKHKTAQELGVILVEKCLVGTASTDDVLHALAELASSVQGIIVQLPLAPHIDTETIIAAIPQGKDVDGMSLAPLVYSPVVAAMHEILVRGGISPQGKNAAIVGQGRLVGMPAKRWLEDGGASVVVVTEDSSNLESALSQADIVVLGAGHPGLVTPSMLKKGVVLLDAGTSEASGKLAGDADPSCADVSSIFTPVPGGIGPIAVVMIFKNLLFLMGGER